MRSGYMIIKAINFLHIDLKYKEAIISLNCNIYWSNFGLDPLLWLPYFGSTFVMPRRGIGKGGKGGTKQSQ